MCFVALSMLDLSGAMLVSETLLETNTSNHNAPKHTRRGKRKCTWPVHELMHWAQENVPKKEHANVFDAGRYPLTITVAHRDYWHHAPKRQKLYTEYILSTVENAFSFGANWRILRAKKMIADRIQQYLPSEVKHDSTHYANEVHEWKCSLQLESLGTQVLPRKAHADAGCLTKQSSLLIEKVGITCRAHETMDYRGRCRREGIWLASSVNKNSTRKGAGIKKGTACRRVRVT